MFFRCLILLTLITCPVFAQHVSKRIPTLGRAASDAIDFSVIGKTVSDEQLYSARDDSTPTYIRNPTAWTRNINLTSVSVYSSNTPFSGVLISPRHVVMANHTGGWSNGSTIFRFVSSDNTIVTRTLNNSAQVGSTDILIGLLDSDVPATVKFAKTMDAGTLARLPGGSTPLLFIDQNQKAFIGIKQVAGTDSVYLGPALAPKDVFWKTVVSGDSSHPIFAVIDRQAFVLAMLHFVTNGDSIPQNYSDINTVMTSLGGGYQLTAYAPPADYAP
jgi:hypothetical protein